MSAATKQRLAGETLVICDAVLGSWQEAFGRGDLEPRDCAEMVDALLDLRGVAGKWAEEPAKAAA